MKATLIIFYLYILQKKWVYVKIINIIDTKFYKGCVLLFKYNKGFTHAGNFHADDVFATAFLRILNPNIEIYRGFIVPDNYDGIVYDIGGGEFDHHSSDRECRENGIMYAAFGKLWRAYADLIVSEYVKNAIDKEFISPLDNTDNTGKHNPLSSVIYNYNGFWNEDQSIGAQNERFFEAVEIAKQFLLRYIEKFNSVEKAQRYVLNAYQCSENGVVVLDKYVPWQDTLRGSDVKVVIYPSNRGGWNAERLDKSGFEFPQEWWGTRNEKNVKGLLFCHSSGFMCNFDTFENAKGAIENLVFKG